MKELAVCLFPYLHIGADLRPVFELRDQTLRGERDDDARVGEVAPSRGLHGLGQPEVGGRAMEPFNGI